MHFVHPLCQVGIFTWAGIAVVMVGLYFLAKAGINKEKDQKSRKINADREKEPLLPPGGGVQSINDEVIVGGSLAKIPTKSFAVGESCWSS